MLAKNSIIVLSKAKAILHALQGSMIKTESSKPKYTQVLKTIFIILMLTKAKSDIACIAGLNDKNIKENIVE
jgi:hypothetical protein